MVQAFEEMEQPDLLQAVKLLKEMNMNVEQVSDLVDNMLFRVRNGEITTDKGLNYLEMKYQMLLSYLINLTFIVLRKCSGEKIESDPSIDRLIEIRTVLEKIRPIDSKLKYQIDKLVKNAVIGVSKGDPQSLHANPLDLVNKLDDSEKQSSDSDAEEPRQAKVQSTNIYVPPKLAAVHFDQNTSKAEAHEKIKLRSNKQFLNSSVLSELREEYSEAPQEVASGNPIKHSISKYEQEKTEYEENYLTRLPVTKAEKNRRKKLTTVGTVADEIIGSKTSISRKHKIKSKKGKGFKRRRTQ